MSISAPPSSILSMFLGECKVFIDYIRKLRISRGVSDTKISKGG